MHIVKAKTPVKNPKNINIKPPASPTVQPTRHLHLHLRSVETAGSAGSTAQDQDQNLQSIHRFREDTNTVLSKVYADGLRHEEALP